MKTIVAKFGGTSLADAEQFRKIKKIVEEGPERRILVASAPGKRFPETAHPGIALVVQAGDQDALLRPYLASVVRRPEHVRDEHEQPVVLPVPPEKAVQPPAVHHLLAEGLFLFRRCVKSKRFGPHPGQKPVFFSGEFEYKPKAEREYIFDHVWKQVKEKSDKAPDKGSPELGKKGKGAGIDDD